MKAYVINLDAKPDNWERFKERWANCKSLEFERFPAIEDNPGWKGLVKSHQEIIRRNLDQEMILFIEDDATCEYNFDERFTSCLNWLKGKEWNLFYGGYTHPDNLERTEHPEIIKGRFVTTHFLIVNRRMFNNILHFDQSCQIDIFYNKHIGFANINMLSKQIPGISSIENKEVDYRNYFINAYNTTINLHKKKRFNFHNLFLPTDKIIFSSFDAYNFDFPHARRFYEIARDIPYEVEMKVHLESTDWVFSDAHMLPHAAEFAKNYDCKLAAVVIWGEIPEQANIAIMADDSIIWRRDILTVITSYYKPKDSERAAEINEAIMRNLNNPIVKEVILLAETLPPFVHVKLRIIPVTSKPIYHDYFKIANTVHGLVMITNSDISLMDTEFKIVPGTREIFTLTRHELDGNHYLIDNYDYWISHDSFIFWAPLKLRKEYFYYPQDVWGSENLTMWYLKEMGYELLNPCKQIRILHHHKDQSRPADRYRVNSNAMVRVPPY